MVTMLYAWHDGVMGMDITLVCYGICVALYILFCFLFRANRTGKGKVLLGWLACEGICDLVWWRAFYPEGYYVNHGISGTMICFLLPMLLVMAAMAVTALNMVKLEKADAE